MAKNKSAGPNRGTYPIPAKVVTSPSAGNTAGDVIQVQGYVGPGTDADHVRLYPSLENLSENVELARADILEHASAPTTLFPYGGTSVWLRKSATVAYNRAHQAKTAAEFLGGAIRTAHLSSQVSPPRTAVIVEIPDTKVAACNTSTSANTCANTCHTCATQCNQTCAATCQTCQTQCGQNTCAQAVPTYGLSGNSNYALNSIVDGNCSQLTNVGVIIQIDQDIVPAPAWPGFSFQLNAFSPAGTLCQWQQYTISVDTTQRNAVITGTVDNWKGPGGHGPLTTILLTSVDLLTLEDAVLPAGYSFEIRLWNDSGNNVNSVEFTVSYNGQLVADQSINLIGQSLYGGSGKITQADLAPIVAFEFVLVGLSEGDPVELTSGAGSFSYSASNVMTVLSGLPSCVGSITGTEENSNATYGTMPCNPSKTFFQPFSYSPGIVFNQRPGPLTARHRRRRA